MAVCKKCENLVNGNLTKENSCQEKWILNTLLKGTPKKTDTSCSAAGAP